MVNANPLAAPLEGMEAPVRDTVPAGQRLVRVGGDRGLSLAEKVALSLRTLAYRSVFHRLRLSGRFPAKLLPAAPDRWHGDDLIGRALATGTFEHLGVSWPIGEGRLQDLDMPQMWLEWLHSFRWLRDLAALDDPRRTAPVVQKITRLWLAEFSRFHPLAWRPDVLGERLMLWSLHGALMLSSSDHVFRSAVLNAMARGARHLAQTVDKAPDVRRRLTAAVGLAMSGLSLPNGEARVARGVAVLTEALAEYILPDGGVVSRSPEDALDLLKRLLTLQDAYGVRALPLPEAVGQAIAHLAPALAGVRMGDGHLFVCHGGGLALASDVAEALSAVGPVQPVCNASYSGFQRLAAGETVVVLDAGPPPSGRVSLEGHAGALSLEMTDGAERLFVNCGGGRGPAMALHPVFRGLMRATAAHSTLTLADMNSTRVRDDGALGRGVGEVTLARHESPEGVWIDAMHDGYVRRFGFHHQRRLFLSADGKDLRGEDALVPASRGALDRRRGVAAPFDIRFHLAAGLLVALDDAADPAAPVAAVRTPSGRLWIFKVRGAVLELRDSVWVGPDGRRVATQQLLLSGDVDASGGKINWSCRCLAD